MESSKIDHTQSKNAGLSDDLAETHELPADSTQVMEPPSVVDNNGLGINDYTVANTLSDENLPTQTQYQNQVYNQNIQIVTAPAYQSGYVSHKATPALRYANSIENPYQAFDSAVETVNSSTAVQNMTGNRRSHSQGSSDMARNQSHIASSMQRSIQNEIYKSGHYTTQNKSFNSLHSDHGKKPAHGAEHIAHLIAQTQKNQRQRRLIMKSAHPTRKKTHNMSLKVENYRMSAIKNKADRSRMDPVIYESQNQELQAVMDYNGGVITEENRDQVLTFLKSKQEPSMTEDQFANIQTTYLKNFTATKPKFPEFTGKSSLNTNKKEVNAVRDQVEDQAQTGPRTLFIETWLNQTLKEAENLEIPGVLLKPEDREALNRYGLDKTSLLGQRLDLGQIERIYKGLFVYSIGWYDMLKRTFQNCQYPNSMIGQVWKVFMILLEFCCKQNYKSLIQEMHEANIEKIKMMESEFEQQRERMFNAESLLRDEIFDLKSKNSKLIVEVEGLQEECRQLEQTMESQQRANEEETKIRIQFETKINSLHALYRNVEAKYLRSLEEIRELEDLNKANLAAMKDNITELEQLRISKIEQKAKIHNQEQTIQKYLKETEIQKHALSTQVSKIETYQHEVEDQGHVIRQKLQQIDAIDSKTGNYIKLIDSQKEQIKHLQRELEEARVLSLSHQEKSNKASKSYADLISDMKDIKREKAEVDTIKKDRDERIGSLREESEKLRIKFEAYETENDKLVVQLDKKTIEAKQADDDLQIAHENLRISNQEKCTLEAKEQKLQKDLATEKSTILDLKDQVGRLRKENDNQAKKLVLCEKDFDVLKTKNESLKRQSVIQRAQLHQRIDFLLQCLAEEKDSKETWMVQSEAAKNEKIQLQSKVTDLKAQSQTDLQKRRQMKNQHDSLLKKYEALSKQWEELCQEKQQVDREVEAANAELQAKEKQIGNLETQEQQVKEAVEKKYTARATRIREELSRENMYQEDLRGHATLVYETSVHQRFKIEELKEKNKNYHAEIHEFIAWKAELQKTLKIRDDEIVTHLDRIKVLEDLNTENEAKIKAHIDMSVEADRELKAKDAELSKIKDQIPGLKRRISGLETEVKGLRGEDVPAAAQKVDNEAQIAPEIQEQEVQTDEVVPEKQAPDAQYQASVFQNAVAQRLKGDVFSKQVGLTNLKLAQTEEKHQQQLEEVDTQNQKLQEQNKELQEAEQRKIQRLITFDLKLRELKMSKEKIVAKGLAQVSDGKVSMSSLEQVTQSDGNQGSFVNIPKGTLDADSFGGQEVKQNTLINPQGSFGMTRQQSLEYATQLQVLKQQTALSRVTSVHQSGLNYSNTSERLRLEPKHLVINSKDQYMVHSKSYNQKSLMGKNKSFRIRNQAEQEEMRAQMLANTSSQMSNDITNDVRNEIQVLKKSHAQLIQRPFTSQGQVSHIQRQNRTYLNSAVRIQKAQEYQFSNSGLDSLQIMSSNNLGSLHYRDEPTTNNNNKVALKKTNILMKRVGNTSMDLHENERHSTRRNDTQLYNEVVDFSSIRGTPNNIAKGDEQQNKKQAQKSHREVVILPASSMAQSITPGEFKEEASAGLLMMNKDLDDPEVRTKMRRIKSSQHKVRANVYEQRRYNNLPDDPMRTSKVANSKQGGTLSTGGKSSIASNSSAHGLIRDMYGSRRSQSPKSRYAADPTQAKPSQIRNLIKLKQQLAGEDYAYKEQADDQALLLDMQNKKSFY